MYFKVIKENFLWDVGCILKPIEGGSGFLPVDDVFKRHEGDEYISKHIIEDSPDYFQRVYKVDLISRVVYETKDRAKELLAKAWKE